MQKLIEWRREEPPPYSASRNEPSPSSLANNDDDNFLDGLDDASAFLDSLASPFDYPPPAACLSGVGNKKRKQAEMYCEEHTYMPVMLSGENADYDRVTAMCEAMMRDHLLSLPMIIEPTLAATKHRVVMLEQVNINSGSVYFLCAMMPSISHWAVSS